MKKLLCILFLFSAFNANAQSGFAFVELFTSQGDETSPLAEQILYRTVAEEEKKGTKVFVLEYHVDYWNRLGWKDPLSKFQFTRRQENYSRVLAEKEMYTPEVVINGTSSFSGTKETTLKQEIAKAVLKPEKNNLSFVKDSLVNDTLYISYTTNLSSLNAVFRFAITENNITTKISAGANSSITMTNNYVVRLLHSVDGVKKTAQIKVPVKNIDLSASINFIAFIQSKQTMEIMTVASGKP